MNNPPFFGRGGSTNGGSIVKTTYSNIIIREMEVAYQSQVIYRYYLKCASFKYSQKKCRMTFLEDNIFRTYIFKTLLKWGKIWIINVDLLRFVRIQVWNKQLLRYQVHNNLMANKLQGWKINDTQYLTWFDSTIEPTSTERNPFFIIRGKSYPRIQF